MKILKEILLDSTVITPQTVYTPKNSEVVDVYLSGTNIKILVLTDPNETDFQLKTFKICTKDENIYFDAVKYIGTFETDLGKWFLIEIERSN